MDNIKSILPEILEAVVLYLSPPEFLKCVQVLHSWPRIIKMHDSDEAQETGLDEGWIFRTFAKRNQSLSVNKVSGHSTVREKADWHARVINDDPEKGGTTLYQRVRLALRGPLMSPEFAKAFTPAAVGLRTETQQEQDWMAVQQFWTLVQNNSRHLRSLSVDYSLGPLASMRSSEFLYNTLACLLNLVELKCEPYWPHLPQVLYRLPSLRSLSMTVHPNNYGIVLDRTFTGLRSLTNNNINCSFAEIIVFLDHLPDLEYLAVSRIVDPPLGTKTIGLRSPVPRVLQVLLIRNSGPHDEETMALLPLGLRLDNSLAVVPGLERIEGRNHCLHVERDFVKPWDCIGLAILHVQIRGLIRLSDAEQMVYDRAVSMSDAVIVDGGSGGEDGGGANVDPMTSGVLALHQLVQEQHARVYERLTRLVRLKELAIGYESQRPEQGPNNRYATYVVDGQEYFRYRGPLFDTLELSLESGLDRLSTLRDLEVFGFEGINHRIGKAELKWMAHAWPRLRVMKGLGEDRLLKMEYDGKKAELREYFT
ncbi:hypothetical protein BGX33_005753 [Mortierella sp. NVP41]|nr:hypothetical protein BGX33_005753 [Mortierella sp. NVP41]